MTFGFGRVTDEVNGFGIPLPSGWSSNESTASSDSQHPVRPFAHAPVERTARAGDTCSHCGYTAVACGCGCLHNGVCPPDLQELAKCGCNRCAIRSEFLRDTSMGIQYHKRDTSDEEINQRGGLMDAHYHGVEQDIECGYCGRYGHRAIQCWRRIRNELRKQESWCKQGWHKPWMHDNSSVLRCQYCYKHMNRRDCKPDELARLDGKRNEVYRKHER